MKSSRKNETNTMIVVLIQRNHQPALHNKHWTASFTQLNNMHYTTLHNMHYKPITNKLIKIEIVNKNYLSNETKKLKKLSRAGKRALTVYPGSRSYT